MTFNHTAKIQPPSRLANTCPASLEQSVPDFARIPFFPYLCENIKRNKWMETILNDYHKKINAIKLQSVASWSKLSLSRKECSNQFKRLREQRLARESKSQECENGLN